MICKFRKLRHVIGLILHGIVIFPSGIERVVIKRSLLPVFWHPPLLLLFFRPLSKCGYNLVFDALSSFVFHDGSFPFCQYFQEQFRNIRLLSKGGERREDGFEVKCDGAGLWHASQSLPIHAQI